MNRADLQTLSKIRRREARALLDAQHWPGAYYLIGYAVECAIKATIAKNTQQFDFPDRDLALKVYTHDLEKLITSAGLWVAFQHEQSTNRPFAVNWAIVKDWDESTRYDLSIGAGDARDIYSACVRRKTGVLQWITSRW